MVLFNPGSRCPKRMGNILYYPLHPLPIETLSRMPLFSRYNNAAYEGINLFFYAFDGYRVTA
jgi:hypothetical protein